MILLPLSLFLHVTRIFFAMSMMFPYPNHNLIFFPDRLDKLGGGGGGDEEQIVHPLHLLCSSGIHGRQVIHALTRTIIVQAADKHKLK